MSWIKNFFDRKDKKHIDKDETIEKQIHKSIKKCKLDKKKNYDEIDQIRKWASNLIHEIFTVPQKYWYEEIENYEKIKKSDSNIKISNHIIEETDEIIKGYTAQINLRRKKIELSKLSIKKYNKLYEKCVQAEKRLSSFDNYNHLQEEIKKHTNILERLDDTENISHLNDFHLIEYKINELEEEFELQEEIQKQIDILQAKYGLKNDYLNANIFTNEINKIINNINTPK